VSATTTSGLAVTLVPADNAQLPGLLFILTGVGACTITAFAGGDGNYNAATNVPQSFNIAQVATVTTLSSSINPSTSDRM